MTTHPLTEITDEMCDAAVVPLWGRALNDRKAMRAALSAALAVAPADPHHDPRPWQDRTREDIRAGDLVEARNKNVLYVGVAHLQDDEGDWWTEDGRLLTRGGRWPLRRIPAPTPPAEEVELPTEHPAHILDVEDIYGDVCAYMALDRDGFWIGVDGDGSSCAWEYDDLTAFTLPDGTRARRDGKREDGTPRFVKEDA